MKKKLMALILGSVISLQGICSGGVVINAEDSGISSVDRVIHLEQADYNDELITIELVEGEAVQLDFQLDPEIYDLEYIQCFGSEKVVVSHTGKLIAYDSGQEIVMVYVKDRDHFHTLDFAFNVNVLPNENISPENRAELNRLQDFWYMDYRRRKLELVGAIDEDAPRLTLEKVQEFIDTGENYREIFKKVSNYVGYPDDVSGSGATSYAYWSDPKGNECIYIGYDEEYIAYTKIADDGTYIGSQMLYPEKTEFAEDGKGKDSQYIKYNQIKPEGYGTLKLKFIDESTGEAFTETNGTFQLMAKPLEGDEDEIEFKSWETSADSTIIIEELPRDLFYTLVYNDEYHTDEQGRLYKYEIDTHKQTNKYSFHYQDYYNFNVYLKRHYSTDPQKVTMGDINMDNKLTIADVAVVQKWLLGGSFYGSDIQFDYWHLADFCDDDKLDVFDLCLMKEKLLENGESAELPTLEEISKMSDEEATELFSKYTFKEIWCIWGEFDWGFSGLYGGGWVVGDKEISLVFNYYTDELESARIGTIPK